MLLQPQSSKIDSKKILDEVFTAFVTNKHAEFTIQASKSYQAGEPGSSLRYGFTHFIWFRLSEMGHKQSMPKGSSLVNEPYKAMKRAFDSFPNDPWVRVAYTEFVKVFRESGLPDPKVLRTERNADGVLVRYVDKDRPLHLRIVELSKKTLELSPKNPVARFQLARELSFDDPQNRQSVSDILSVYPELRGTIWEFAAMYSLMHKRRVGAPGLPDNLNEMRQDILNRYGKSDFSETYRKTWDSIK
ncbi:hypothetical protein QPK87_37105 [Kamptonema cortianum]|nr:hypothetical protein [Geitlerinema splendidum]MDK3162127.1 hypothetical protein [Kamptonema cortianum]